MLETKIDIKKTALIIIDTQNDMMKEEKEPFNAVTKEAKRKVVLMVFSLSLTGCYRGLIAHLGNHIWREHLVLKLWMSSNRLLKTALYGSPGQIHSIAVHLS